MRSHRFHYGALAGGYVAVVNYVVIRAVDVGGGKQQLLLQEYMMGIKDSLEDLDVCVGCEPEDILVEGISLSNTGT